MKKVTLKRIGDSLDMNSSFKKYPLFGNCDYADLLFNLNDVWNESLKSLYGNKMNEFQRQNCTMPAFEDKTLSAIMGTYNEEMIESINKGYYFERPEFTCVFVVNAGSARKAIKKAAEQGIDDSVIGVKALKCLNNEEDGGWYYPVEKITSKLNPLNKEEFKTMGDYKMKEMCDNAWLVFGLKNYKRFDGELSEKGKALQEILEGMLSEPFIVKDDAKDAFEKIKSVAKKYYVDEGYPLDVQLTTVIKEYNKQATAEGIGEKKITNKELGVVAVKGVKLPS